MMNRPPESISVVVPVYNEEGLIKKGVLDFVRELSRDFVDFELILVDDGSSDGTGGAMDELAKEDARIRVLHNIVNLNVGVSVQRGILEARKKFVVHNAVDFPLAAGDIKGLVDMMEGTDVLVLERKTYAGYTAWRWMTSKLNRLLLRMMFGRTGIRDMNFTQIYRTKAVPLIMPLAKSPAFTTPEMILRARRLGLRVGSADVAYRPRKSGRGAFGRPHDIMWSLYDMLRFRLVAWGRLKQPE